MAEHDSEREPEEKGVPLGEPRGDSADKPSGEERHVPFDEDAAWQAIVAGYGEEPPDPPGVRPFRSVEDLALPESEAGDESPERPVGKPREKPADKPTDKPSDEQSDKPSGKLSEEIGPSVPRPLGSSIAFTPGVGSGPRDYQAPEPGKEHPDEEDEGHFVPPEPPPLPAADATARFAWLAVVGGPVLLLLAVLLGWDMTWWLAMLGIGGFLGGFATLVIRMRDDEDDDDPGHGAVV